MLESPTPELEDPSHPFWPEARRTVEEIRQALAAVVGPLSHTDPSWGVPEILQTILNGHAHYLAGSFQAAYDRYREAEYTGRGGTVPVLPKRLFLALGEQLERLRIPYTSALAYARAGAPERNYAALLKALATHDRETVASLGSSIAKTTPDLLTPEEWRRVAGIAAATGNIHCLDAITDILGPPAIREELRLCGHVLAAEAKGRPIAAQDAINAYRLANAPDDIVAMAYSLALHYAYEPVSDDIQCSFDEVVNAALRASRENGNRYDSDIRGIASALLFDAAVLERGEEYLRIEWSQAILQALVERDDIIFWRPKSPSREHR